MKIAIVSNSNGGGGAGLAAERHKEALVAAGLDCRLFVLDAVQGTVNTVGPASKFEMGGNMLRSQLDYNIARLFGYRPRSFYSSGRFASGALHRRVLAFQPDVIHLHWVSGGAWKPKWVGASSVPVVWSLHDLWPVTGGCHYPGACECFKTTCGRCPELGSNFRWDFSWIGQRRKTGGYGRRKITFVGLSEWIGAQAQASRIGRDHHVVHLPNPIDTELYKPMDRRVARDILGIPHDRKILLFGAIGASSDPRKGAALLREALAGLTGSDCECVVIGNTRPELGFDASVKVRGLGVIRDRYSMVLAYNAADVVVVPSLQENLSNVIMESLSCGTPVVGFRVGGNIDMIEDGWNGAIAERISGESLRDAINRTLHAPNLGQFGVNARTRVVSDYSLAVIGKKYEQLYKSIQ